MQDNHFYAILTLDRSRRRWRLVALVLILIGVFTFFVSSQNLQETIERDHIAMTEISGFIGEDRHMVNRLNDLAYDDRVKAVIVHVDSPGGTMVGGLNIFHALRRIANEKPVAVTMGTVAASAGYLVALGGDLIVANEATLTGSVGVFMPLVDARELADKIGVKNDSVSSGNLKMATSPLENRDGEARAYLQGMVNDLENIFLGYVQQRRKVNDRTLSIIRDGRTLIGAQARQIGLVDALGGEEVAREWLEKKHGIGVNTPIHEINLQKPQNLFEKALTEARIFPTFLTANSNTYGVMAVQK